MFENFNYKTFHYSDAQLSAFEKELNKSEGFNDLMFQKNALEKKNGSLYIAVYSNLKKYRKKYLTGEYKSLRSVYNTKTPYLFWSKLYIELQKKKEKENIL